MNEHILPCPNHLLPATAREVSGESQELDGETEAWRKGLACSSHCLVQAVFQVCSVWMALFQVALTLLRRRGVTGHRLYRTEGGVWWWGEHPGYSLLKVVSVSDPSTISQLPHYTPSTEFATAWSVPGRVARCFPGDHQRRPWRRK